MQFADNNAYMYGEDVVIHQPKKEPRQFKYQSKLLTETEINSELVEIAKAHALWPMYAYREQKYLSQ